MDVIALTGGIAAGKSTVAARLAEHGAIVIDADQLAREAVAPGSPGLAAVVERFGAAVLTDDGALDRAALGSIIFGDETERAALNAIVHPEVRRLYRALVDRIAEADPDAIVVYDVPLLVEARAADEFALVVVAHAPAEVRVDRLVDLRGLDRASAQARAQAQASDAERLALADVVIDTSGTLESTIEQVDALWRRLVADRAARTGVSDPSS
ncbi:MAG: dephospho-CoA kinase [Microcella sp.]